MKVYHKKHLDGGGRKFMEKFEDFIRTRGLKADRLMECFAGCAFIGFHLLEKGICSRLSLLDINKEGCRMCSKTVKANGLEGVKIYNSDCLDSLPATEKYDIIVSNPPNVPFHRTSNKMGEDPGFEMHRRFYEKAGKHLKEGGHTLFLENAFFTYPISFYQMITENGLDFVEAAPLKFNRRMKYDFYFVLSAKRRTGT